MFHTPIDTRTGFSNTAGRRLAFGERPFTFLAEMDLCRNQVNDADDCEALRFAAKARKSTSPNAFDPAFATGDWRVFASYCIVRRLPAGYRVAIPGRADRTLRFVVEGSLWQESASNANRSKALLPGTVTGEDGVFSEEAGDLDVRTLEDSVVLELSYARQKELTASCPEIAFELLRAAGAVIAARGRPVEAAAELVAA